MKIGEYKIEREILGLSVLPNLYDDIYYTYNKFKRGDYSSKIDEKAEQELDILYVLEGLGYGSNQTGTYLLKDMVVYAIEQMLESKGKISEMCRIRQEMKTPFSQFYMDIARGDRDMGLKTFHTFVNLSYVNRKNIKRAMVKKTGVIPARDEPENQAFKVALYYIQEKGLKHDIFVTPTMHQQQNPAFEPRQFSQQEQQETKQSQVAQKVFVKA